MKIFFLVFGLFIISINYSFSQHTLTGYTIDKQTNKTISDVIIKDITNNKIYKSAYNGYFEIPFNGKSSLLVSFEHLSYKKNTKKFIKGEKNVNIKLTPNKNNLSEIIITATQKPDLEKNIPYNFQIYSAKDKTKNLVLNIDDFLKNSSSINILRPKNIFSNAPIITTSGMGGIPGRTLILYNGVPLNKTDDGNVNWNMLPPASVSKIETAKNPLSGVYGNNAMGGVINFLPKMPIKPGFKGFGKIHTGTFNTLGAEINTAYKHKSQKGFFFNFDSFAQKSDGYISTPDSLKLENVEYLPSFLKEIKLNLLTGYDFNGSNKIELCVNFFDDKRGLEQKIYEPQGTYTKHSSQFILLKYNAAAKKSIFGASFSFQNENYFKNIENIKNNNYNLINVNSHKQDFFGNIYYNIKLLDFYNISTGINLKNGQVIANDNYINSGDLVTNKGLMNSAQIYIQNTLKFFKNNNLIAFFGMNSNFSKIKNPTFIIERPTSATDFMMPYTGIFADNTFNNFSFNTGLKWNFAEYYNIFSSFNSGYNAPTLDDLTRSGLMRFGFKLANPELLPEKMTNLNLGFNFHKSKFKVNIDGNFNNGYNFMYYIQTGETILNGKKNIIQKQNITNVKMYDFNANLKFLFNKFEFFANYTYNYSFITKFDSIPEIENNLLIYSPVHKMIVGGYLKIGQLNFTARCNMFSKQYINNENTQSIPAHYTIDLLLNAEVINNIFLEFSVQNLTNYQYLYYNQTTFGRFMLFSIKYKW